MLKIGHRGAAGYAPENTLASFQKALELGVDAIEFDVHVCKTGEVMVIHDETVKRTTDGRGAVAHMSFSELRELDAGGGEKIPTLEEVLDLIDKKVVMHIELKGLHTATEVAQIIERYIKEKGWRREHFLVSSFSVPELKKFRHVAPDIDTGLLVHGSLQGKLKRTKDFGCVSINPESAFVTKRLVRGAHEKGLKVFVWTLDDPKKIEKIKALGVDGIFSNYPDRL